MKPFSYYIEKFLNSNKSSKIENIAPMPTCVVENDLPVELDVTDVRFEKLAEQVASLVKHYDAMSEKISDENMKALLSDMTNHLINTLVLGGCDPIADEKSYDAARHIPQPMAIIEQGIPIVSYIRIGVSLSGKVLIPAIVEISK